MTDKELRKSFKKLGIILTLTVVFITILSVYTLGSTKAELSVYTKSDNQNFVQAYGIDEEEFKKYLSVFGNLVDNKKYEDNFRTIKMATDFIDNFCSTYEIQVNELGIKKYDSEIVNKVIKETTGAYINKNIETKRYYRYNDEEKIYEQNEEVDMIPYCIKIEQISKNGDKIEVIYKLAIMTKEQMAKYFTGQEVDLEIHNVKAVILNNTDYEYSKYFVSSIEEM